MSNYRNQVNENFTDTLTMLEAIELVMTLADKNNLHTGDLELHEKIKLVKDISEKLYESCDEIEADRKYWLTQEN